MRGGVWGGDGGGSCGSNREKKGGEGLGAGTGTAKRTGKLLF